MDPTGAGNAYSAAFGTNFAKLMDEEDAAAVSFSPLTRSRGGMMLGRGARPAGAMGGNMTTAAAELHARMKGRGVQAAAPYDAEIYAARDKFRAKCWKEKRARDKAAAEEAIIRCVSSVE